MILKPYPENVRSEMYLVALAHDLIKTRHIPKNFAQKWKGDYLSLVGFLIVYFVLRTNLVILK